MKQTQNERILRHLREKGCISPLEALSECGCFRLAARISDLKSAGHRISSRMHTHRNSHGEPVRYATYYLEE